jgi:hypothetical protein
MTRRFMKFAELILPYVSFASGALNVLFWGLYFSGLIVISKAETGLVTDFESAFPVADGVLGVALLIAGAGLLKRKPYGGFFLIAAAGMAIYLGLLDVTFYGRHGMYLPLTMSTVFSLFINAFCIGGGVFGLCLGWRFWRYFNDSRKPYSPRKGIQL